MEHIIKIRGLEVEQAIHDYIKKQTPTIDLSKADAPIVIADDGTYEENIRNVYFSISLSD